MLDSCLGLYINDNYIKYAKLVKNKDSIVELELQGIYFVNNNINEVILNIIKDTDSQGKTIVINAENVKYQNIRIFKQISNKDVKNIVKLEYEDWCEKFAVPSNENSFVYDLTKQSIGDYRHGTIAIVNQSVVENRKNILKNHDLQIYPTEIIMDSILNNVNNYMLLNFDDNMYLSVIKNSQVIYQNSFKSSMSEVFERFTDITGSVSKSYEVSKNINVFTDSYSESNENKDLENILEPILRDALKEVTETIEKYKVDINKLYITGTCTLFTNIDTLMTEFFGLKCEILVPEILFRDEKVNNISDLIEATPAIVLAKSGLEQNHRNLDLNKNVAKYNFDIKDIQSQIIRLFNDFLEKVKSKKPTVKREAFDFSKYNIFNKEFKILKPILKYNMYVLIALTFAIITYTVYSNMYMSYSNIEKEGIEGIKEESSAEIAKIESDINYVNNQTNMYKSVNSEIDNELDRIYKEQLNKPKTYKVASFMQEIIQIIPSKVKLISISSDDNKHITLKASSSEYEELGYFLASIKVQQEFLDDIKILITNNSSTIEIEIEGDLP